MGGGLTAFAPESDARAYRDTLGRFATGVTIVTCACPQGPIGITANSFASVSLDPPLVLWSPAKSSNRYRHFAEAPEFAIHVLADDQAQVCLGFLEDWAAFDGLGLRKTDSGLPIFEHCLARYECALEAAHDAGDHMILVGRVTSAADRPGTPLIFQSGRYGSFKEIGT